MREILFRGKTQDGKWAYGIPVVLGGRTYILSDFRYGGAYIDKKVIGETVGQFTGLTDKNGKKIFEGDIIQCEAYDHEFEDEYLSNSKIVVGYESGYFYPFHLNGGWRSGIENAEVIGNIHDKPELLEDEDGNESGGKGSA